MPSLTRAKVDSALERVSVHYMPRKLAKMLNSITTNDEPRTFCGYYWFGEGQEAGPFKSRSAAIDDAHTKLVARRARPHVGHVFAPPAKQKRAKKWTPRLVEQRAA